ncbi:hypothetical protein HME9304_02861 [Flagellimonas maritima]|uniref:DNA-binding response regulator n=1 Tax=Flagellimonas maritima TaxID=1383885 RepID=A0A2Z4LVA8_9FLAO|nr:LytTR family DNA-binding domain-containing protein [Allomuricauda aurantiaca]AWX45831.1 hypothetical protein HME9304_02861 [Allomuricauda aurantiaca]
MELKKILICEDEKLVANRLKRFVENTIDFPAQIELVPTLDRAFEFLSKNRIDLLFLDLNLHGRNGFEILKKLASESFHTIIVSAYTDRAIEAFEYGVLDFVGKPFTMDRLKIAIDRFKKDDTTKVHSLRYIAIKGRKGVEFISVEDVDYIKASGIYSELILKDSTVKIYDKPMNQLLKLLPEDFERIHKSFVIPTGHIKSISQRKSNTFVVELKSGSIVPISRTMRKKLINKASSA